MTVWGTGAPRREFLYSDDMAAACLFVMNLPDARFATLLGSKGETFDPPLINIGVGEDLTIRELAEAVRQVVGFQGGIAFDSSRPDGTMRKLMDVSRLRGLGWQASKAFQMGLADAYGDFLAGQSLAPAAKPARR